jgi:ATP-dependent RNA helicase SUPV3L1/SUV3
VVTQAMTSLTGSAGEDFASILRALGYRMDRRAPLPPKPVAADAVIAEAVADDIAGPDEITIADIIDQEISGDPAPSVALTPVAGEGAPAAVEALPETVVEVTPELAPVEAAPVETAPAETAVVEAPAEAVAEVAPEAASSEAAPVEAAADGEAKPETPAEPVLIEVWRPGGRSEERRPHHDRNRQRHHGRPQGDAQPAAAAGEGAAEGAPREPRHRRGRRNNEFRKPREGAPADGAVAAAPADGVPASTEARTETRHERPRFEGKGRDRDNKGGGDRPDRKFGGGGGDRNKSGGDRGKGGGDRGKGRDFGGRDKGGRDSGPSHRQWATTAAPRDRDRPADPNSPFAKLAALKEQLAGNRKD